MNGKRDIGKIIKEQITGLNNKPNDLLWLGIKKELERKQKKKKRIAFWVFIGVIFFSIGLFVFMNINFYQKNQLLQTTNLTKNIDLDNSSITENYTNNDIYKKESDTKRTVDKDSVSLRETFTNETGSFKTYKDKKEQRNANNINNANSKKNKSLVYYDFLKEDNFEEELTKINKNHNYDKGLILESSETIVKSDSLTKNIELKLEESNKESNSEAEKEISSMIYIYYAPTLLGNSSSDEFINKNFSETNQKKQITSSYGVYYKYRTGDLSIGIGLSQINVSYLYQMNNFDTSSHDRYHNINLNSDLSDEQLTQMIESNSNVELKHNLFYYEIPIEVGFLVYEKKKFSIDAFLMATTLIKSKDILVLSSDEFSNLEIGKSSNFRKTDFHIGAGIEFRYNISKKINISISPLIRTNVDNILNINDSDLPKTYILQLRLGASYNLGF